MAFAPSSLKDLLNHGFDAVIDVRAPAEFAEDHIPGAISLLVLSDEERARVGTIYVQDAPFKARKIGAALVARNAARHIEGPLSEKDGAWRPLVYCWRGGQRSGAFASMLAQIGWRVDVLDGGYRTYRRMVNALLYEAPWQGRIVLLDGNTGTAKTELLNALADRGVQTLDLEAMARHRGSLFGAVTGGQPSQKAFESALAMRLARFDSMRPLVLEAESSKIGTCLIPPMLWQAMQSAERISIEAPVAARARYLLTAYSDLAEDRAALDTAIARLKPFAGKEKVEAWPGLSKDGAFEALATGLIEDYYDPRYKRAGNARRPVSVHRADALEPADIEALADAISRDPLLCEQ